MRLSLASWQFPGFAVARSSDSEVVPRALLLLVDRCCGQLGLEVSGQGRPLQSRGTSFSSTTQNVLRTETPRTRVRVYTHLYRYCILVFALLRSLHLPQPSRLLVFPTRSRTLTLVEKSHHGARNRANNSKTSPRSVPSVRRRQPQRASIASG